ncbi:MAG: polymerase [Dehalococcoidia bacterium]|nr:polymerase [Dehalococcoidia bacterium]
MNNAQIAHLFESIAALLEAQGESVFKIRAYQRAAHTIEHMSGELGLLVEAGDDLRKIPGIGEAIAQKIIEMVTTGRLEYYERLKAELPDGILTLMDVPGIGPKTALLISRELGVSTMEALEKAIVESTLAALPRLGEKTAENRQIVYRTGMMTSVTALLSSSRA